MPSTPHLVLQNVTLTRGARRALDGISLALAERRVGLIGRNGSGKSSLLRLAHGLALPDEGTVKTLGLDTAEHRKSLPRRVGFLFQSPDQQIIFPTVLEEVAFGFEERGLARKAAAQEAARWLDRFGRSAWADRPVHELSGGQKQLVCLISVLALEPDLVLLDEPFASLDLTNRLAFADELRRLAPPVVMASHDLDFLADFDRVLWLEAGRIRKDGPPSAVLPAYREAARDAGGEVT
ncbi:MAG TPA: ABC transporter ATP-binding protein [Microvirga sp.]|nr:ABC transporter ATP-binding protein [Microvirga sp.]